MRDLRDVVELSQVGSVFQGREIFIFGESKKRFAKNKILSQGYD